MVEYVAGFLFDEQRQAVVLIQKNKPEEQAGKWNGVGGKIEEGELPTDAMRREFEEETGVDIPLASWQGFTTLTDGKTWAVHFYRAFAPYDTVFSVRTVTDEVVQTFWLHSLPTNLMVNVKWLVHMALSMDSERAAYFEVNEKYAT
jgi:8-oxo-dGTP diphosphatase